MKYRYLALALLLSLFCVQIASADAVIAAAQQQLKQQGFYAGTVDGQMGSQTAAAIRRFQLAQDLKVTGQLNQPTLDRLGIKATTHATQPVPEYVAIADIFKGGPYISIGAEAQIATIRQAQKNLKLLGYYGGPINGSPSASLVQAIKAWQKSAGFRQTGRFDENTLKGLDLMPN